MGGPEISAFIKIFDINIILISETHYTTRSCHPIYGNMLYDIKHPDGTAHGGTAAIS